MVASRGKRDHRSASPSNAALTAAAAETKPKSSLLVGRKTSAYAVTTAISVNGTAWSGGWLFALGSGRERSKRTASSAADAVISQMSAETQETLSVRWNEVQ